MCCFVCVVCACGVVYVCVVLVCACGVVCGCGVVLWLCRVGVSVSLSVCMWCCVWCVCGVWCVLFFVCVCTCGVGEAWHAGKPPCVSVQNASVCTVRTSPCVPATGPNVQDIRACCRYTRRRPDRTHGGVLNGHTGGFSSPLLFSCLVSLLTCLFLFFFLSFLFSLFSFIFSFIFSFCTHRDEIRQTSDSTN